MSPARNPEKIYPGDPRDEYQQRRGLLWGLLGVLFVPAQGVWLRQAVEGGGAWWTIWAIVLAILIASGVLTYRREQQHRLDRPPIITSMLIAEAASIAGWILLVIILDT